MSDIIDDMLDQEERLADFHETLEAPMTDKELEARLKARINGKRYGNLVNPDGPEAADAIAELRKEKAELEERVGVLEGALHEAKLFVYGRSERLYQHLTHVLRTTIKGKETP